MDGLLNSFGWIGFVLCALAYLLLNLKILKYDSLLFQGLNVLGGGGLLISAYHHQDSPNIASNIVWLLIAVTGMIRYGRPAKSRRSEQ